ncbi:MAG: hypothetical protein IPH52_20015 [Leptospiraceae bacterium]|nr:hypothetical protein [Leptospiraceae bacterium]
MILTRWMRMFHRPFEVRAVVDGTSDGTQIRQIQFGSRSSSDANTPTQELLRLQMSLSPMWIVEFYPTFTIYFSS